MLKCRHEKYCLDSATNRCETCKNNESRNAPKSFYEKCNDNRNISRASDGRYKVLNYKDDKDGADFQCPMCKLYINSYTVRIDKDRKLICPHCGCVLTLKD